jgi:hypothetical protein
MTYCWRYVFQWIDGPQKASVLVLSSCQESVVGKSGVAEG